MIIAASVLFPELSGDEKDAYMVAAQALAGYGAIDVVEKSLCCGCGRRCSGRSVYVPLADISLDVVQ